MNSQNIKEKLLKEKAAKEKTVAQCQKRIKDIDAKLTEIDNTEIIGIVRAYNLTPEQLSELLRKDTKKDEVTNE